MGLAVDGAVVDAFVLVVALKIPGQVVVNVLTVFQSQLCSSGQHQRQARIAVAVTVSHATAVQRHRGIEQRAVGVLRFTQPVEEIGELLEVERVTRQQVTKQLRITIVV